MLSDDGERLRVALYRALAADGRIPDVPALAEAAGVAHSDVPILFQELASEHHLALGGTGDVVLAHPFATRSFGFSVMSGATLWWGGCAWDAFAIPNLVPGAAPALVATDCPACGAPHAWKVGSDGPPDGDQVAHFLVPMAQAWSDVAHTCAHQRIFCSDRCIDVWVERTGNRRGYVMDLATLWRLAAHWYDGRLETPYRRREPSAAADYFRSVGLRGAFWGLKGGAAADQDRP